jgi:hypothetical protein
MSRPPEKPKRKNNNPRAWTSGEDERLLQLIISNASVIDIAAELGRTVRAVSARAYALRIALGRSRFRVKAK